MIPQQPQQVHYAPKGVNPQIQIQNQGARTSFGAQNSTGLYQLTQSNQPVIGNQIQFQQGKTQFPQQGGSTGSIKTPVAVSQPLTVQPQVQHQGVVHHQQQQVQQVKQPVIHQQQFQQKPVIGQQVQGVGQQQTNQISFKVPAQNVQQRPQIQTGFTQQQSFTQQKTATFNSPQQQVVQGTHAVSQVPQQIPIQTGIPVQQASQPASQIHAQQTGQTYQQTQSKDQIR